MDDDEATKRAIKWLEKDSRKHIGICEVEMESLIQDMENDPVFADKIKQIRLKHPNNGQNDLNTRKNQTAEQIDATLTRLLKHPNNGQNDLNTRKNQTAGPSRVTFAGLDKEGFEERSQRLSNTENWSESLVNNCASLEQMAKGLSEMKMSKHKRRSDVEKGGNRDFDDQDDTISNVMSWIILILFAICLVLIIGVVFAVFYRYLS
ncbi:hypothetical protein M3Y97_01060700 [Aphelenchoides bicaudatus]|nr:hypothetical protein M3Y97_01060700 [Aphelenchoides bicaudatus]